MQWVDAGFGELVEQLWVILFLSIRCGAALIAAPVETVFSWRLKSTICTGCGALLRCSVPTWVTLPLFFFVVGPSSPAAQIDK